MQTHGERVVNESEKLCDTVGFPGGTGANPAGRPGIM